MSENRERSGKRYGRFGDYDVLEKIGQGAFGKVYRAWDSAADREVALKILRSREDFADEVVARFRREAQALARIHHESIVRIFHVIHDRNTLGICMEFLTGKTLRDILDDRGPFSHEDTARIGRAVCSALGAVHAAGFIHRDVKAENLIVPHDAGESGRRVVLMDFGITRPLNRGARLTAPGVVVGTPVAMAPEQHQAATVDARTDVYAVGSLLFQLLTNEYPFTATTYPELRRKVLDGEYDSIEELRPDVPTGLKKIIGRAMARYPEDRFQTAQEMEEALGAFLGEGPVGGKAVLTRSARRQNVIVGLLVAILIALLVLIGVLLSG